MRNALMLVVGLVLAGSTGCSENQKATEACKDSPTMEACTTCCKSNGANGHSAKYMGDTKECKCLGGG